MRGERSCIFRAIFRSFATMIRLDGLFRGHLLLTSIRSRNYHLYAMGGIDSELFRKECRGARKSKSLNMRADGRQDARPPRMAGRPRLGRLKQVSTRTRLKNRLGARVHH
jgi:hypothetical protein